MLVAAGCAPSGPLSSGTSPQPAAGGASVLHSYTRRASDPDWLARAGEFHGHLGPWVTVGAIIGEDARKRLESPLPWGLDVICYSHPDQQRQPFSCILDGLQTSTGATMGKRNIRFAWPPAEASDKPPVVCVIRRAEGDADFAAFVYRLTDRLRGILAGITPDRLEAISREIVGHRVEELFEIRPMTEPERQSAKRAMSATTHTH